MIHKTIMGIGVALSLAAVARRGLPAEGNIVLRLEKALPKADGSAGALELEFPIRAGQWPTDCFGRGGIGQGHHHGTVKATRTAGGAPPAPAGPDNANLPPFLREMQHRQQEQAAKAQAALAALTVPGELQARGASQYLVVITIQDGAPPQVQAAGAGRGAKIMVGGREFAFDGEKFVVTK